MPYACVMLPVCGKSDSVLPGGETSGLCLDMGALRTARQTVWAEESFGGRV